MNCIIVDDEPLAREAIEVLVSRYGDLNHVGSFNSGESAALFMKINTVDLVFLDIQMPHINGIEFAQTIPNSTLIIFTTAFTEYAMDSYEIEAIDYLVKPIKYDRFVKAVNKAIAYQSLLEKDKKGDIENIDSEFIIVKSERKYYKLKLADIYFIEGLKDYVIIHLDGERIITKMNLKTIHNELPKKIFLRVNKSYIVNSVHINSFDNNDLYVKTHVVPIGNAYREAFFNTFVTKKI